MELFRRLWEVHPTSARENLFDSLCSYVPNFKLRHILHADARKDSTVSLHDELAAAQVSAGTVPTATTQAMETSLTADIGLG